MSSDDDKEHQEAIEIAESTDHHVYLVGDNDEVEVSDEFVASVLDYANLRAKDMLSGDNGSINLLDLQRTVAVAVILETVHQMAQDGLMRLHERDLLEELQDILDAHRPPHEASDDEEATCNLKAIAAIERLLGNESME